MRSIEVACPRCGATAGQRCVTPGGRERTASHRVRFQLAGLTIARPDPLRQSQIARFDNCALSLLLDLQQPGTHSGNLAAVGTIWHRWVARVLALMRATGETTMGVDQGLTELLHVLAQRDVPAEAVVHIPIAELKWLRIMVTKWCEGTERSGGFDPSRIMVIEGEWAHPIAVPDGRGGFYERTIVGHPDVVLADPPDGIIIVDWKSGWAPPAKLGTEEENEQLRRAQGSSQQTADEKLTDQGYAQQVIYGILGLKEYPAINKVTLREAYLRHGEYREATIDRYNLERLADVLGAVVAQIDQAIAEGPESARWIPSAGVHCGVCPAPRHCPLKEWQGIPESVEEAQLLAHEWMVAAQVRKERTPLLKGWVDGNGPIPIRHGKGRREVGWKDNSTGNGRTFKLYEPDEAPESPWDERLAEAIANRHG